MAQVVSINLQTNINQNVYGYDIDFSTSTNTFLGNSDTNRQAKGIKITLENISASADGKIIGLAVTNENPVSQNIALFQGGNVGIGTTSPVAPLNVVGTIRAGSFEQTDLLSQQEAASFNNLIILSPTDNLDLNGPVTANNLNVSVLNIASERLEVSDNIDLSSISLQVTGDPGILIAEVASINTTLDALTATVLKSATSNSGLFTSLGIETEIPASGLASSKLHHDRSSDCPKPV